MLNFTDKTGEPRSDEDLQEAIDVITMVAVKYPMAIPPLTVNLGNIRDCLKELQHLRKIIAKIKTERDTGKGFGPEGNAP